jgi:predicted membrane-bound spermidine synthase
MAAQEHHTLQPETRRTVVWYGFTIFLSSAILLVLEIVAGRIIAPYVGVSIYSWTSIIGVILAGLSLGNWVGGHWADRGAGERVVGIVLLLAAVFSVFGLLSLGFIATILQARELDLISSSFLYVLMMFFIPAVLLGIVTPVLTTEALRLDNRIGHIVGRMHALAALGSIFGTFLTGYWLVQFFGTRMVVLGSATCLALLALPFLRQLKWKSVTALILLTLGTVALTHQRGGFASPCQWESNYFCLRVVDHTRPEYGPARALVLDHLLHGINHESRPELLISPYVHAMDEIVRVHFSPGSDSTLRYFFAGGGAYTQPRAVKEMYPEARITVAEIDPQVTRAAEEALFFDAADTEIIHRDARTVLSNGKRQFDVIVTDVFHDISVPYHMVTQEFARTVRQSLSREGIYLVNIVDIFPDPRLVKSLVKTLQGEFSHVDVWLDSIPGDVKRVTYILSAQNSRPLPELIVSQQGFRRQWIRINEPLFASGTPMETLPVLSDDFVPVERLLASLLLSNKGL